MFDRLTGTENQMRSPPSKSSKNHSLWHVSPWADIGVYHFGWLWVLIPGLVLQSTSLPKTYCFLAAYSTVFIHRHFGFLYAYLDPAPMRQKPYQLSIVPGLFILAFLISPVLYDPQVLQNLLQPLTLPTKPFVNAGKGLIYLILFIEVVWSVRHSFLQKYGILRLYSSKAQNIKLKTTPIWVDRLFIFGWFPLYAVYLGGSETDLFSKYMNPTLNTPVTRILKFIHQHQITLLVPCFAMVVTSIVLFLIYEWTSTQFKNKPRLSMALGTTLLFASITLVSPLLAVLAFIFNHSIEYILFVINFLNKRYRNSSKDDAPLIARLHRFPLTIYLSLISILGILYFFVHKSNQPILLEKFFGLSMIQWFFSWEIFVSLIHSYTDGFLWKMGDREVRGSL